MASARKTTFLSNASNRRRSGGTVCCVPGCKNNSARDRHVSFHGFPADRILRQEWIRRIGRSREWQPSRYHKICGAHFNISGKKTYEDRVPTIFPHRDEYYDDESLSPKRKILITEESASFAMEQEQTNNEVDIPHHTGIESTALKKCKIEALRTCINSTSLLTPEKIGLNSDIIESLFCDSHSSSLNFLDNGATKLLDGNLNPSDRSFPPLWSESELSSNPGVEVELSTADNSSNDIDLQTYKRDELNFLRNMLIDHMQTITEQAMEIDRLKKTLLIRPSIEEVILLRIELAKQRQLRNDMEKRLTNQSVKITTLTENVQMLQEKLERLSKKGRDSCYRFAEKGFVESAC